jgi:hypothetical protein
MKEQDHFTLIVGTVDGMLRRYLCATLILTIFPNSIQRSNKQLTWHCTGRFRLSLDEYGE